MGKSDGLTAYSLKCLSAIALTTWLSIAVWAQRAPKAPPPHNRPTAPANETRTPGPVRSPHSMGKDLTVPLCPSHFDDNLTKNGVAGPHDKGITPARITHVVPAKITQQAMGASGTTHIGNYIVVVNVVVNAKGLPQDICLQKSAGYGLDAAAAAAVEEYQFSPARKDGKSVQMRLPIGVRFISPEVGTGGQVAPR